MTTEPHILVIDDDERLRGLLKKYLSQEEFLVSSAADAFQARKLIESIEFDLAVVDKMMPGKDGVQFIREMRAAGSTVPFIMLTAMGDLDSRIEGLTSGADDYLPKPFEPKELKLRILNILKRIPSASGGIRLGRGTYDRERSTINNSGRLTKLTTLERNIIDLLIDNAGRPMARSEIARAVGEALERSIDVAIARLRRKIEADPKLPSIILTVRNAGYKINLV